MKVLINEIQLKNIASYLNESVVEITIKEMKNKLIPEFKEYIKKENKSVDKDTLIDFLAKSGNDTNWYVRKMSEFLNL